MREEQRFFLIRGETEELTPATLIVGMTRAEMESADAQWQPFLEAAVLEAHARGIPLWDLPEHLHWDWKAKAERAVPEDLFLGIRADNHIQGMMILLPGKLSRLPGQNGLPLVYIDYLATAPWNLRSLTRVPRFRGVGKTLVRAAIAFSQRSGYQGRIGLHSLPQAEGFYAMACRMTSLGPDAEYGNLRYFELGTVQTARLQGQTDED